MSDTQDWILGKDDNRHSLQGLQSFCDAVDRILPQGRRTLRIQTPTLDSELLNRDSVSSAVAALIRVSPNTRIRLLLNDSSEAVRGGHCLIRLAQRFPSYFEIRKQAEWSGRAPSWLVVDETAIIWRRDYLRYTDGHAICQAPAEAGALCHGFDESWEQARPDPDLRRLHL